MDVIDITSGLRFPEGPVAMADGSLLVVEIERGTLTRIGEDGGQAVVAQLGGGPNGAAIGPDGHCYVCNNGGFAWVEDAFGLRPHGIAPDYQSGSIQRVDLKTGHVETVYDRCDQEPLNGPNDLVFDAAGGFYFTDFGKIRRRHQDRGAVFYATAGGSMIREVAFPLLTPNGVAISPDETVLYVSETEPARVWAFDLEAPGQIRKRPWPSPNGGRLVAGFGGYERLDSMAIDREGNICVAAIVSNGLFVIAPGGAFRHVKLPGAYATNVCFGGPDLRTAYVTLSSLGRVIAFPWETAGLRPNFFC
ncbi:SMP-30/gluconolactonase/LRE family protein [Xanthobacter dioxanivorans]|uniref:SMP-30/gluconolactonase/LRE family protein n=2 Tax=Xanthobacter dioxanivorans TaxID=2528964 RepID=A0A974PU98_9HYPH|nr:SMP-30/gluconolactonase/LRE family protein [Xanthobacter dioxanivorans]